MWTFFRPFKPVLSIGLLVVSGSGAQAAAPGWINAREGMPILFAATASPTTYVLAGAAGDIWTSTDGASWAQRSVPQGANVSIRGATYGNNRYILVGESRCCSTTENNALVLVSSDAATWTVASTAPAGNAKTLNAVKFGGASFVGVGRQGVILVGSQDASSWTASTSGTTQDLKGVAWSGSEFIAVGDGRTILRSTNGVTWTASTVPATTGASYAAVTWGGSQFVVVGDKGAILTSVDGTNWTDRSLTSPNDNASLSSVAAGSGVIVAGDSERVFNSSDGITWTKRSLKWNDGEPNPYMLALTHGPAGFVGTGGNLSIYDGGTVQRSADGITWTKHTLPASRRLTATAFANNTFCAVGFSGAVSSSPDGVNWTNRVGLPAGNDAHNPYYWYGLISSSSTNLFVAVGSGVSGAIMTSPDCVTWTNRSSGGGPRSHISVVEGGSVLVAVGGKSPSPTEAQNLPAISTSTTGGASWTIRDPTAATAAGSLQVVSYRPETSAGAADGYFVAMGGNGVTGASLMYTSPDGVTWTQRTATGLPATYSYALSASSLAWGNGRFVLVSGLGTWTSPDGIAWTSRGGVVAPAGVIFANGMFVAVGTSGKVWISTDGIAWTTLPRVTNHSLSAAAYSAVQDRFVLVGEAVIIASVPTLGVGDVKGPEGHSGLSNATFTISLSKASQGTVTVNYSTIDGTASAGTDYVAISGTLTFAPGESAKNITVQVFGDTTVERNEAFGLRISSATGAALSRDTGQCTIQNDDETPGVVSRPQPTWQEFFAVDTLETPYTGDFNGDGRTDIITLTRQNPAALGDVYVALSNGSSFGSSSKWHDWFAISTDESVTIGDFNGDGKDDIATWLFKTSRQVYVALSTGSGMAPETVWLSGIGSDPTDLLQAGDANGDGRQDLILFARKQGLVYVALSNGTGFQNATVWHNFFAVSTYERPRVGDVTGDGRADIITFATDSPTAYGDVYVAASDGTQFVDLSGAANASSKWHDFFAIRPSEEIRIGDLDGDGKDDFFTFLPPPFAQCYTVLSQGTAMAGNVLWAEAVAPLLGAGDNVYVGDVNGDGKGDIIIFAQSEGRVFVSLAP